MRFPYGRHLCSFILAGACLLVANRCSASIQLNLATAADLANLVVGQTIGIRVELAGLDEIGGETLDFLAATVAGPESLLGTPSTPVPGAIVPDASGFSSFGAPGLADGFYDVVFATTSEPISASGLFFEFEVTPIAVGSGTISFGFVDGLPGPVTAGLALEFFVGPGDVDDDVPEPQAVVVWGLMATCGTVASVSLRRRAWQRSLL